MCGSTTVSLFPLVGRVAAVFSAGFHRHCTRPLNACGPELGSQIAVWASSHPRAGLGVPTSSCFLCVSWGVVGCGPGGVSRADMEP